MTAETLSAMKTEALIASLPSRADEQLDEFLRVAQAEIARRGYRTRRPRDGPWVLGARTRTEHTWSVLVSPRNGG
jgi:hypothetical protein